MYSREYISNILPPPTQHFEECILALGQEIVITSRLYYHSKNDSGYVWIFYTWSNIQKIGVKCPLTNLSFYPYELQWLKTKWEYLLTTTRIPLERWQLCGTLYADTCSDLSIECMDQSSTNKYKVAWRYEFLGKTHSRSSCTIPILNPKLTSCPSGQSWQPYNTSWSWIDTKWKRNRWQSWHNSNRRISESVPLICINM